MSDDPASLIRVDFDELLRAVSTLLQQHGRLTYRGIKRRFGIDDAYLEDLKAELIEGLQIATDEDGRVLRWVGTAVAGEPAERSASTPVPAVETAERRQLTIMFCDLVNSTELSTRCDPEDYRELMQRYHRVCAAAVARYGGYVAQYLGDGIQVYFGYPSAQDDAAARAVHAGLEIVRQLSAAETEPRSPAVRIGIHTGPVIVADLGDGGSHGERLALGETPNIAARVQTLAAPDSVVVSAATRALLRDPFMFEALGEHALKGITRPVALFRPHLTGLRAGPERGKSAHALCGRVADLALLSARFEAASAGVGQLVAVTGEPGIGKSCLIDAFRHQLGERAQQWEARCCAFHAGTALHPIAELLRRTFQIDAGDAPHTAYAKLRAGLAHAREPEETLARFSALLSLPEPLREPRDLVDAGGGTQLCDRSPRAQRLRTIELLTGFLLERADREPVLMVVEDLHWADPSTLEFLDTLHQQARSTRAMILVTHRPGFAPACAEQAGRTTLTLERLEDSAVMELIRQVTENRELPENVLHELLSKSDGMPLFVEEMTRMLLASSCLEERGARYELTQPLSSVGIPVTIADSLMARLDQLGRAREVAQVAAVLGRSFRYDLLAAVWPHDEALLLRYLTDAVRSGLLLQRGFPPQATYVFKHALVQEVAYSSMLRSARKRVHKRTAQALGALFPQLAAAQPELVAQHFAQAGCALEACTHYQRAAEKALEAAAYVEAVRHVCDALSLLLSLPAAPERDRLELSLLTLLCVPLIATQGYACKELAAACERAHALCNQVGGPDERWPVLHGLWYNSEVRGAFDVADRIAAELEALARVCRPDEHEIQLLIVRGHGFWRGRLQEARASFERVLTIYDEALHLPHAVRYGQDPLVVALSYLNGIYSLQGELEQGRACGERAIAHARRIGHRHSLVLAVGFATSCAQMRGDLELVRRYARETSALAEEQGSVLWAAQGKILSAYCDALAGDVERGSAAMHEGLQAWNAIGARLWHTHQLALLAEVHLKSGRVTEGLLVIERAQALADQQGERFYGAELLRLRAELELARQPADSVAARTHLVRALELAHEQGARLFEQRALRAARRATITSGVFSRLDDAQRAARTDSA